VKQVVNVIGDDPVWGKAEELCDWPEAASAAGHTWRLDRIRSVEHHTCRKFYTLPEQPVSWAALVDEKLGCQLRLDWPSGFAPYLGLWIDEGMFNTAPVAALEPANGYYDSLENSIAHQRVAVLQTGQETAWTIKVELGDQKLR
jgi:hypothetical protein